MTQQPDQPDRAARLRQATARDGGRRMWCGRALTTPIRASTDHLVPRLKGGPSWLAEEAAACRRRNRERGHPSPFDWLDEWERRGWQPGRDVVLAQLAELELERLIGARGGQRRARPYLDRQRRGLRRMAG